MLHECLGGAVRVTGAERRVARAGPPSPHIEAVEVAPRATLGRETAHAPSIAARRCYALVPCPGRRSRLLAHTGPQTALPAWTHAKRRPSSISCRGKQMTEA